jgi:DNA-binding NtrC family response regulator
MEQQASRRGCSRWKAGWEMSGDEAPPLGLAAGRPVVLVVEADVIARMSLCERLRAAGLRVIEAFGPEDALKVLGAEPDVDLLLTDLALAGPLNGVQLAGQARALSPRLEVIITSDELLDSDGHHLTLYDFMHKPYAPERLVGRIRELTAPKLTLLTFRADDPDELERP